MQTSEEREKRTHHGHAVARLRRSQGIKQSALADMVGVCQQTISAYEQKEVIEDDMLDKIAAALSVSPELIRNLEEDPVNIYIESNNTIENNTGNANQGNYVHEDNSSHTYNPVDKIVELCEKLLKAEQEKIALLEKLLKEKK